MEQFTSTICIGLSMRIRICIVICIQSPQKQVELALSKTSILHADDVTWLKVCRTQMMAFVTLGIFLNK